MPREMVLIFMKWSMILLRDSSQRLLVIYQVRKYKSSVSLDQVISSLFSSKNQSVPQFHSIWYWNNNQKPLQLCNQSSRKAKQHKQISYRVLKRDLNSKRQLRLIFMRLNLKMFGIQQVDILLFMESNVVSSIRPRNRSNSSTFSVKH